MGKHPCTALELRELLTYDPDTGALHWLHRAEKWFSGKTRDRSISASGWNKKFAGKAAFTAVDTEDRICGRLLNTAMRAHVVAFALHSGEWPEDEIDHINGDPSDNRASNLRLVSHAENMRNLKICVKNTSGIMGVGLDKWTGKWRALITVGGKRHCLGRFFTKESAIAARKDAEAKFGFHENHNRSPFRHSTLKAKA